VRRRMPKYGAGGRGLCTRARANRIFQTNARRERSSQKTRRTAEFPRLPFVGTPRIAARLHLMTKAEQEKTGLKGRDKTQADLRGGEKELPEGLLRERKGPLDKDKGRDDSGQPADRS
jgi:hypothetical protein